MSYIDKYCIKKLSNLKYPDIINSYTLSDTAKIKLLKKYKKKITVDDIIEIIENKNTDLNKLLYYIGNAYNNIENINDDIIIKLFKHFRSIPALIDFLNKITNNEIFVGNDIENCYNIEKLLMCRSYRIYKITKNV